MRLDAVALRLLTVAAASKGYGRMLQRYGAMSGLTDIPASGSSALGAMRGLPFGITDCGARRPFTALLYGRRLARHPCGIRVRGIRANRTCQDGPTAQNLLNDGSRHPVPEL